MPDPIILNPGQWNECLVRQMTDEERARYGAPVPISEGLKRRRELKKLAEEEDGWIFGTTHKTRKQINERLEANVMNKLGAQVKIDRVRMYELCREHGTSHAAKKKIAGELGCSWQTIDQTIRKENFAERIAKETELATAPTIVTPIPDLTSNEHLCSCAGSFPEKCAASSGMTHGTERRRKCSLYDPSVDGNERLMLLTQIPVGSCAYVDALFPDEIEVEVVAEPDMPIMPASSKESSAAPTPTSAMDPVIPSVVCPDDLYIEVLDKVATAFVEDVLARIVNGRVLALRGIEGIIPFIRERCDFVSGTIGDYDSASVRTALTKMVNTAIMGLMLLDSMEAD